MKRSLQCDHFQAFSNMEETRPGLHTVVLFLFLFVFPLSLYMEDQTLLSQASRDLKINLLSITHECKDYSSCDLKERILYCSFH